MRRNVARTNALQPPHGDRTETRTEPAPLPVVPRPLTSELASMFDGDSAIAILPSSVRARTCVAARRAVIAPLCVCRSSGPRASRTSTPPWRCRVRTAASFGTRTRSRTRIASSTCPPKNGSSFGASPANASEMRVVPPPAATIAFTGVDRPRSIVTVASTGPSPGTTSTSTGPYRSTPCVSTVTARAAGAVAASAGRDGIATASAATDCSTKIASTTNDRLMPHRRRLSRRCFAAVRDRGSRPRRVPRRVASRE